MVNALDGTLTLFIHVCIFFIFKYNGYTSSTWLSVLVGLYQELFEFVESTSINLLSLSAFDHPEKYHRLIKAFADRRFLLT